MLHTSDISKAIRYTPALRNLQTRLITTVLSCCLLIIEQLAETGTHSFIYYIFAPLWHEGVIFAYHLQYFSTPLENWQGIELGRVWKQLLQTNSLLWCVPLLFLPCHSRQSERPFLICAGSCYIKILHFLQCMISERRILKNWFLVNRYCPNSRYPCMLTDLICISWPN